MSLDEFGGFTGPPENRRLYAVRDPRAFRRGGIGVVYEAVLTADRYDVPAGTRVGLKLLTGVDADRFAKLTARGSALREHPHPHLAQHLESFVGPPLAAGPVDDADADLYFSVHVWVDGVPLTERIPDAPVADVLTWAGEVAEALDHLHGLPDGGFAHRDVHARNVIVRPDGHAVLIDFDTLLGGEPDDTRLSSLHGPVRPGFSAADSAQAHDRSMLALTLLRALGRDATATSSMSDLALRSLESMDAVDADAKDAIALLLSSVRQPPETAAGVVSGVRAELERRRGRLVRRLRPRRTARELARLQALAVGSPEPRRLRWIPVAVLALALVAGGGAWWAMAADDGPGGAPAREVAAATQARKVPLVASAIAAGEESTCAVLEVGGDVACWGALIGEPDPELGGDGGDVATWKSRVPVSVSSGGFDVPASTAVSVATSSACLLGTDERVRCWGSNESGALGQGTVPANEHIPVEVGAGKLLDPDEFSGSITAPSTSVDLRNVRSVHGNGESKCAVVESGRAYCWGARFGGSGLVVDGSPVEVEGYRDFTGLSMSWGVACGVAFAQAVCWGTDAARLGQQTVDSTDADFFTQSRPEPVQGLPDVEQVVVGSSTTCAISTKSELWCWGSRLWEPDEEAPPSPTPVRVPGINAVRDVGMGSGFLCALTTDDRVQCLGNNDAGQLGSATPAVSTTPLDVGLSGVSALAVGGRHVCVLAEAGEVWCWGSSESGQIGDGKAVVKQPEPQQVTVSLPDPSWTLEPGRFGPLTVGMSSTDAIRTGLVRKNDPRAMCGVRFTEGLGLAAAGLQTEFTYPENLDDLDVIGVWRGTTDENDPLAKSWGVQPVETAKGIRVGSSIADVKEAYGDALVQEVLEGEGGSWEAYVLFGEDGALVFSVFEDRPDHVGSMSAVQGTNLSDLKHWAGGC